MTLAGSKPKISDEVRAYVEERYVRPARERGEHRFSIVVGDVHKALRLFNRVPLVCSALRRDLFLEHNRLRIVEQSGPPSGMSTTVRITYEFTEASGDESQRTRPDSFLALRGILRDVFRELGGGENFIRREREAWGDKSVLEKK